MIKIGGEMIKLLTTKESTLLRKLANLLKEYDAIISCDTSDEVKIIVFERCQKGAYKTPEEF